MINKKTNRTEDNILKYSPQWINKYNRWINKGKPKEFTVYLLHDKKLKVKKLGRSTKIWDRQNFKKSLLILLMK